MSSGARLGIGERVFGCRCSDARMDRREGPFQARGTFDRVGVAGHACPANGGSGLADGREVEERGWIEGIRTGERFSCVIETIAVAVCGPVAGQVTELNPGSPKGIERTRALWAGYKMFGDTTTWEQFMSERAKVGLTEDYGY